MQVHERPHWHPVTAPWGPDADECDLVAFRRYSGEILAVLTPPSGGRPGPLPRLVAEAAAALRTEHPGTRLRVVVRLVEGGRERYLQVRFGPGDVQHWQPLSASVLASLLEAPLHALTD